MKKPQKRIYDIEYYHIVKNLAQIYINSLIPYTRENVPLFDILGIFGGWVSILVLFAGIIILFYNNLFLKHELVNSAFQSFTNEKDKL